MSIIDTDCEYTIITSTTGHPEYLERCLRSVQNQENTPAGSVRHMVVIDGKCRSSKVQHVMSKLKKEFQGKWKIPIDIIELPYPTGTNGWICHRINGALPYLCNSKYVSFLDEDNGLEPNHCNTVLETFQKDPELRWIFTLRNLMTYDGSIVGKDMCESIGDLAPTWNNGQFFVDTNCYVFTRQLATQLSPLWFRKARQPNEMDADRAVSHVLLNQQKESLKHTCTNCFTINYMVGNRSDSVQLGFFERGNEVMKAKHYYIFKKMSA
jgi:hypothetical protein